MATEDLKMASLSTTRTSQKSLERKQLAFSPELIHIEASAKGVNMKYV